MKSKKNKPPKYLQRFVISIIVIGLATWLAPHAIPEAAVPDLVSSGSVITWIYTARFFLLWACAANIVIIFFFRSILDKLDKSSSSEILTKGFFISLLAGTWEEIAFRFVYFLSAIVTVQIGNFLFFGFLGFGIPEWFYLHVAGPIANFTTLGYLEPYLFFEGSWAVGAAILSANAFFRDGHKYQGVFGWINSWFGGMLFFYLAFNYGLLSAIFIHFLYDMICFATAALSLKVARAFNIV